VSPRLFAQVPDSEISERRGGLTSNEPKLPDVARETACALANSLRSGTRSVRDVVEAHLDRIAVLDSDLSAFITVNEHGARAEADRLDKVPLEKRGVLHGLPIAIKDLTDTGGIRTTYGSALFANHVPSRDDLVVSRLRNAGAVILGKSNTPEFGFGAICSNQLCGPTRNPFDHALTSGGSSGGSAVAVAAGMVALAHGTDFGGSVRTPASFCGVASIRPTPGSIPAPTRTLGWDSLATHGVMARNVADCALMLGVVTGTHPEDPTSRASSFTSQVRRPRIATSPDLGVAPMSVECRERFSEVAADIARHFGPITSAAPDCKGSADTFKVLRSAHIEHSFGHLSGRFNEALTPTVEWNIAQGQNISAHDYLVAEAKRTILYRNFIKFFSEYDLLITPAASVLPWSNEIREITTIDGNALSSILDYLTITSTISLVGFPVLTIPAPQGSHLLPFGVQVIARPGEESLLVSFGRQLETVNFIHKFAA
jgi:amidase